MYYFYTASGISKMGSLLQLSLVMLMSSTSESALDVRYVKPNSPPLNCPGQPCLTLDQYVENTDVYFVTGATFVFLTGDHSLVTKLILRDISDLTLRGSDSDIKVIYRSGVTIECKTISRLKVEGLKFNSVSKTNIWFSNLRFLRSFGKLNITAKALANHHPEFGGTFRKSTESLDSGAIWEAHGSSIEFIGNSFSAKTASDYGGAVHAYGSNIMLTDNAFIENTGENGGAVYVYGSTVTLNSNTFTKNTAESNGGAVYAHESNVTLIENIFSANVADHGGIMYALDCNLTLTGNSFSSSIAHHSGGAVHINGRSIATISNNTFTSSTTDHSGGAVFARGSDATLYLTGNSFSANVAYHSGGAVYANGSNLIFNNNTFTSNIAHHYGGAVYFKESNITLNGNTRNDILRLTGNSFRNNTANYSGGAVYTCGSNVTVQYGATFIMMNGNTFSANTAGNYGGAVCIYAFLLHPPPDAGLTPSIFRSNNITLTDNVFSANTAVHGGAVCIDTCVVSLKGNNFSVNTAYHSGGAAALYTTGSSDIIFKDNTFTSNIAHRYGGAVYSKESNITLNRNTFTQNTAQEMGGAVLVTDSSMTMEIVGVTHNSTTQDGTSWLSASDSNGTFSGTHGLRNYSAKVYTLFERNTAKNGGAISVHRCKVMFNGDVLFQFNTARDGGALYVSGSDVVLSRSINFTSNSANIGGAIYVNSAGTLNFKPYSNLTTSHNYASEYGGAVFYDDVPTQFQCNDVDSMDVDSMEFLPRCFVKEVSISQKFSINSYNDSAAKAGGFLHGGLLDKCILNLNSQYVMNTYLLLLNVLNINSTTSPAVTSKPYHLLFCGNSSLSRIGNRRVYPGQEFVVSLLALAQGNTTSSTLVTAKVSSTASLKLNQSIQTISNNCSDLSYNMYSTKSQEELILYADGPCRDTGNATAVVNVTFLPCPDAFVQSSDRCTCDKRLQVLGGDCIVGEPSFIVRKAGSSFWMSALYTNSDSYQGLILYKICPMEYCTSQSVNITLDNLDVQCDLNRSGVLCGACATNYSLMLGSSKCHVCSNTYLALLVPFAAAGIALVVFLTFLRLTVATGMINGLILYANIVQVNKHLFLPADHTRLGGFLTAFIAWLNLDLGIQTCFFNGMDAYAQTWLQFAFPVYVWILIGLIVLTSRYSITVSKLIGSNPIAVLATLLLMSYTKILRIVIAVYSSVDLDYPDNKTVTVWLKDANVPYLQSKHLLLTVVTSLVLVFLFLPYTLLLLLGHKLYRYSDRKVFCWLNRIKPLLDSYYAPYKFHTRCWTGLLLLVRCALYIEFSLGTTNQSLLAIIIIFSVAAGYLASGRIYSYFYTNIVEISLYLNLIVLSTATATDASPPALVHALLGLAFATMVGIFVYHFHISYTAKSVLWLRLRAKLFSVKETDPSAYVPLLNATANSQPSVSQTVVSIISLREPLLES